MIIPADLHPADLEIREDLRAILVDLRREAGLSQARLAQRVGVSQRPVAQFETSTTWRISTVQRYAHALGARLVMELDGLPWVDMSVLRPADPAEAMVWDRRVLLEALRDARESTGMSTADLAEVLGCAESTVRRVESESDVLVITAQRHARALGGSLALSVEVAA